MPQDISALIAATAANTHGKTTYHTPLDITDANVVHGAAGTLAEQPDETHYDQRKNKAEDEERTFVCSYSLYFQFSLRSPHS